MQVYSHFLTCVHAEEVFPACRLYLSLSPLFFSLNKNTILSEKGHILRHTLFGSPISKKPKKY